MTSHTEAEKVKLFAAIFPTRLQRDVKKECLKEKSAFSWMLSETMLERISST